MITFENTSVVGVQQAIRGMRNPLNSWDKSDSLTSGIGINIGDADLELAMKLVKAGTTHSKFRRMITVYVDITAPLYWWKEFDTYKVGTVANSCSTMHTIHKKEFTLDDFSHEHLISNLDDNIVDATGELVAGMDVNGTDLLWLTVLLLNAYRKKYLETNDKKYWWQMIQLLPSSYNQRRTVMLNYEVLANIYETRRGHKLDEWRTFLDWIEYRLPYPTLITGEINKEEEIDGKSKT